MVIQHCGQQIVRRTDCMKIPGEMQVDVLHGHNLGISAAGRTAFHTEHGTKRRLSQGHNGLFSDPTQTVCKSDRGCGLPFPGRRRGYGRDQNEFSVLTVFFQKRKVNLGLVFAIGLQKLFRNMGLLPDLPDRPHFAGLCNFNIG